MAAFRGPSFDWSDPEHAVEALVESLPQDFGISADSKFFAAHWEATLGDLVVSLLSRRDA